MKIAITGHRPNKLGNDYDLTSPLLKEIRERILKAIRKICDDYKIQDLSQIELITGMALGIDTLFAKIAVDYNLAFIAAIPCIGQDIKWPNRSRSLYHELIKKAKQQVLVTNSSYTQGCMQKRNMWMVNNCDVLIAVWDGSSGGTANCIYYAKSIEKPIFYINPKSPIDDGNLHI